MYLAWTTVSTSEEAAKLAQDAVEASLAACVQIDGPVTSRFIWDGKVECASEFRLCFKCTMAQLPALEEHVLAQHPYEIPEWIVVRAERVGEKYLSWAQANSSTPPL